MKIIEAKGAKREREAISKSAFKATQNRLKEILKDIAENPRSTNFGGEQLKYKKFELWSKSLTKKDRVVYGIEKGCDHNKPDEPEIAVIYQYLGHYSDK